MRFLWVLTERTDDDEEITNPEGVRFDIGHDFLRAVMSGGSDSQ